jgi:hypothetical protein
MQACEIATNKKASLLRVNTSLEKSTKYWNRICFQSTCTQGID